MSSRPSNKDLAIALGITENEVGIFLLHCEEMAVPGRWMLTFAAEASDDLRRKAKLNKALIRTVQLPPTK